MLIVIVYTFYNSSKITSSFINVTVTIVQYSYIYIYIDGITLLITSEEHYYYHQTNMNIMCFATLLEKDLLIQYLYTKTFVHVLFDHILKVVDVC